MNLCIFFIVLAFILRIQGDLIPFYAFRVKIFLTRLLPSAILFGILIHSAECPYFPFMSVLSLLYVTVALFRACKLYASTRRFQKEILINSYTYGNIRVLPTEELVALNVGFLRPKIVLSEGVLSLPERDRKIVLEHESYHLRRKDNLRLLLFELLLPTEEDRRDFRDYLEIMNDSYLSRTFEPKDIAHTLVKFSTDGRTKAATAMASSLVRRLRFLSGEESMLDIGFRIYLFLMPAPIAWYTVYMCCLAAACVK